MPGLSFIASIGSGSIADIIAGVSAVVAIAVSIAQVRATWRRLTGPVAWHWPVRA
jgi:hypothetical protein